MPTHWESSKRPLFVRTVVVNGGRHAILTQEDPFGQIAGANKTSRPDSACSTKSSTSDTQSAQYNLPRKDKEESAPGEKKGIRDLQACLIKLRLVLAAQEGRKSSKIGAKRETNNKKRKRGEKGSTNKKTCQWQGDNPEQIDHQYLPGQSIVKQSYKYDSNQKVTLASFYKSTMSESYSSYSNFYEETDQVSKHAQCLELCDSQISLGPSVNLAMCSDYDITWNRVQADSYLTKPFYNKLSERVLQWLDLAKKNKHQDCIINETEKKCYTKILNKETKHMKQAFAHRDNSSDHSEEVRVEEDVDTALSKEFPKFSQDLNRLHYLKAAIPVKSETYTAELQESIAQSFTTLVSIHSSSYTEFSNINSSTKTQRREKNTREVKFEESSEGGKSNEIYLVHQRNGFQHPNFFKKTLINHDVLSQKKSEEISRLQQVSPQMSSKIPWLQNCKWPAERELTKPQLHIFIPAVLPEDEQFSDTASIYSDS